MKHGLVRVIGALAILVACRCGSKSPTADASGDAASSAGGACMTDSDCAFNAGAGCCGACLAKTDKVPPPLPCGAQCPARPPACVCENHRCVIGTLKPGDACSPGHDLCGYAVCCQVCSPIPQPDGGGCAPPTCMDAFPGKERVCLQPP